MPLLNHFAPPLSEERPWTAFHSRWANAISDHLNEVLPRGFYAGPEVRWRHEGDSVVVAMPDASPAAAGGGVSTAMPPPARTVAFDPSTDVVEVRVVDQREGGPRLVGVVEVVSPANKDGRDRRAAFVEKAAALIASGVATVVADIVVGRSRSLHRDLMRRLGEDDPEADPAYAAAYRLTAGARPAVDVWYHAVSVGSTLPELPMHLPGGPSVMLPLEATYLTACRRDRIELP